MYIPEFWGGPDGYAAFFASLADAARSRPDAAQQAANLRFALIDRLRAAKPSRTAYDNGFEAYYGNHCADAQYPQRFATQRAIGEFAERGSLFGPHWRWLTAPVCADWPVAQDRHVGPWFVRTSAPALVIGNYFYGVTSYEGAVASSKLLVGSRLLSYAGWGHTAFGRNECITRHTVNYLLRGTLPPKGTVCPANDNPFALSLQRRAVSAVPSIGLPPSWLIR
jgi:hypothetical protein